MDIINHRSDLLFNNNHEICSVAWQNSTIEERNIVHEPVCVTISPSQFRPLLKSTSDSDCVTFARQILQFVIEHIHSPRIIVLIADQIQKYNTMVFSQKNERRSLELAVAQGQKIAEFFFKAYEQLPLNGSQTIKIITWADILIDTNYNSRLQHIRQYINNNESQCGSLIDKVCDAYVQARKSPRHLTQKDLTLMREYVINELPSLLNGIQYEQTLYKYLLHPTLKTGNSNGNKQREAMTQLLDHMRRQYLPNAIYTTALCHIFDVEIPIALVKGDMLLTHSPGSSSSLSAVNIDSSNGLGESSETISNTLVALWLTLISQFVMLIIYHFRIPIFSITIFLYGLYFIYILIIWWISKLSKCYSTSNENGQQVLGTNYQSFFANLPTIQASQI